MAALWRPRAPAAAAAAAVRAAALPRTGLSAAAATAPAPAGGRLAIAAGAIQPAAALAAAPRLGPWVPAAGLRVRAAQRNGNDAPRRDAHVSRRRPLRGGAGGDADGHGRSAASGKAGAGEGCPAARPAHGRQGRRGLSARRGVLAAAAGGHFAPVRTASSASNTTAAARLNVPCTCAFSPRSSLSAAWLCGSWPSAGRAPTRPRAGTRSAARPARFTRKRRPAAPAMAPSARPFSATVSAGHAQFGLGPLMRN